MSKFSDSYRIGQWSLIILAFISLISCEDNAKEVKPNNGIQLISQSQPETAQDSSLDPVQDSLLKPVQDYSQTEFKILDFAERDYKGSRSLGLVLSVPLDKKKDFQSFFVLEKRDGERVDGTWILADNGKELFFKNIEPEKEYLLTVYANLEAINNTRLGERYKKSITTKAIEASVGFAHSGGILPLGHSRGIPIYSINIAHVDVEFHRVKSNKLISFLQTWQNGGRKSTYQLQNYAQQSDFVYSARFDLDIEKNKRQRVILPINNIDELSPAGIYIAMMKVPGQYEYRQAVTYFTRSDIGVNVRRYPGQLDVYIRSLMTANSLENVKVSLLDKNNQPLTYSKSNSSGKVSFTDKLKKARLLLAQKGEQMSLVRLNSPALDLSEFNIGTRTAHQNEAFIYAPRDLYRPGEEMAISLLLRNNDGQMIPAIPLKGLIKQQDGQVVDRFTWQPEKPGYYHYNYKLSDNAKTGQWYLEVQLPGNDSPQKWYFSVEDFLPERMKLTINEPAKGNFINPEETLIIPVEGQYLYGAPASGNRLETTVHTYIKQEVIDSLPGYLFGLNDEKDAQQSYDLKPGQLNKSGKMDLSISSQWKKIQSPITIQITSSLFETGGRAIKRQSKFYVWPKQTMIGIRPHDEKPKANTLLKFDIVNADHQGQLYTAEDLQLTLIKKRRDYYWSYDEYEEWQMDYSEKQYPVFKQTLAIKNKDKALVELSVEWGEYRLEIYNPATQLTNSIEFNAGGSWYYANEQARIARPDKVNMILDKPAYKQGDIAQLTIKSPFTGKGIILVENNQQALWQQEVDLKDSNETIVDIAVQKEWQSHDIYISAILFNQPLADLSKQDQKVKRAIGLIHLPLDRSDRHLELSIESVEKSKPFAPLSVKVILNKKTDTGEKKHIDTAEKKVKEVMLTLAAVDVGVLNVSNFISPDPFSWFFAQRRYTIDSLDLYGNIMDGRRGIMGKQRFGGDMDLSSAGNLQKADIKIVSLFHQPVLFNEQGEAQITLDIPDFNGTLRLMAVAFDEQSFGHAEQEVVIAAPVVTQLSLPRFLAANDKSIVSLDVHNLSDQPQSINIKLSSDEYLEIIDPVRHIDLDDKEKISLNFAIKSRQQFGLSDISLHLVNENAAHVIELERQWQLAVRPAWPAVQRNKQVILKPDELVTLKITSDDLMAKTLAGELLISNQPPINLASHLKHLLKYPYGCLEQTTSSSFPWLFAEQEKMALFGLDTLKIKNKPIDFSKRQQYLERGVKRLSAKQLTNGGFGLWSNQSSEEMWLTVYASHFLLKTKAQGIDVPGSVLKPAIKRMQQYLRSSRSDYNYRYSQSPAHLTLAYKSYAAYVLSGIKQAPLGTMRTLFDYHKEDARSGLPLMHLGIALSQQGDLKRGGQAIEQALQTERSPDHYLGDYGSTLRDLSLMLEALIAFQPSHQGIAILLEQLQNELARRQWLSTQERNALFMAGVALKENAQQQWQALIQTATKELILDQSDDFKKLMSTEDITQGIALISSSKERLYVGLDIGGYTKAPPEPDFKSFNINRTYYNTRGEVILPDTVSVGDLMIVELSLQAKNRIQDALVVDLLPAGFEIENQNLEHSIKLEDYKIGNEALINRFSANEIKYQAWRDDRYIAAIDLNAYGTQRLYYLLRAVTPGTYQVPPPYAEDMYRPYIRAIGETPDPQTIINQSYKM